MSLPFLGSPRVPGNPGITNYGLCCAVETVYKPSDMGLWARSRVNFAYDDWQPVALSPFNNYYPQWQVWQSLESKTAMVLCSGLGTFSQTLHAAVGYGATREVPGGGYSDAFTVEAAKACSSAVRERVDIAYGRLVIAGHSFGGGVAMVVAALQKEFSDWSSIYVASYGAPILGDKVLCDRVLQCTLTRYCNKDDPITALPNLPARAALGGTFLFLLGEAIFVWENPRGGITMTDNGWLPNQFNGYGQKNGDGDAQSAIDVLPTSNQLARAHAINAYKSRINALSPPGLAHKDPDVGAPVEPDADPGEQRFIVPLSPERRLRPNPIAAMAMALEVLHMADAVGVIVIPKIHKWYASFDGLHWWASWEGQQLVLCPTRSHARTLSSKFNKALRYMQRLDGLAVVEFNGSAADYATAATDPAGGFKPVLSSF